MSSIPMDPDPTSTQAFGAIDFLGSHDGQGAGLSPQDRAAIAALPAGTALLLIHHGPTTGARWLDRKSVV